MSIEVDDVRVRLGDSVALHGMSLAALTGTLTAVVGPSGAGKSTLLRAIAGLVPVDEGRVVLGGRDVTTMPPRRREVGYVSQGGAPFTHLTVRENVAFGLRARRVARDEVDARVDELLRLVQLPATHARRYPRQLSGGECQRMALARALAVEPAVLLLDEPFGAVDALMRTELREWLRELHDEVRVTTLLVTHDHRDAFAIADQVVVLRAGGVEQAGPAHAVRDAPATAFVARFLASG